MRINYVTASNFLSWEKLELDFEKGVTAVTGENKTQEDQGSNGTGKALSLDSDIMTPTGSIKMRDIKIGDTILGFDGKPQSVIAIPYRGIDDCYRVTFSDGTYVDCNKDHLWKVASYSESWIWKVRSLREIMEKGVRKSPKGGFHDPNGDRSKRTYGPYNWRIPSVNGIDFKFQKVSIDPYTLGALLGDGSFNNNRTGFTNMDQEILDRIVLPDGLWLKLSNNTNQCDFSIIGTKESGKPSMVSYLDQYGLKNLNCWDKFIPKEYIYNSREVRLEVLRGLFDTDGYVDKNGIIEIALTSEQMVKDIQFIARSLGCLCHPIRKRSSHYNGKNGERIQCKDHYRLRVVPPKGLCLFHLSRKAERAKQEKKFFCVDKRIVSIDYIGKVEQQCITVSNPDGLFLTNDFIVTHNSSIQQIIYYAAFGNSMKNILDKKLIQIGASQASTEIEFYCPMREQALKIERTLSMKGSAKLKIFLNDSPVEFATVNDGNKTIIEWIGISLEDIRSYYLVCKEFYKSFFKSSDTEKLALISRFINFSYIDKTKDIINNQISELNADKRAYETDKAMLEGKLEVYEETLVKEEMRDFEAEKNEMISSLEDSIQTLEEELKEYSFKDIDNQHEIKQIQEKLDLEKESLKKAEKQLSLLPDTKEFDKTIEEVKETLAALDQEQREFLKEQDNINKKRGEIKVALQRININLGGAVKCPNCGHEFLTLKDTTLEKEKQKKEQLRKQEESHIKQLESIEENLKDFEDVIAEAIKIKSETLEDREKVADKIYEAKRIVNQIQGNIESYNRDIKSTQGIMQTRLKSYEIKQKQIEGLKEQIEIWRNKVDDRNTEELETAIANTAEFIRQKEIQIQDKVEEIFKKDQWINRFRDFKRYLALEQLKNIQNSANELLKKQKSDLRVLLEGFKLDSKGKVKEGITPYVLREEAESFWYYSGGERARVEIAVIMAFQSLINLAHPYGGLDFLFIDEVLEGLSEDGLYNVIDSLDFVDYPILIITHVSNQNIKSKALKVEKINNISRLV